jgi:phosphoribosyl-AMP cyclohydrolase
LLAIFYTGSIECAANDFVTNTWKVANTTTTNKHDAVLLQVVTLAWNVRGDFNATCKTNTSHLTKSRVRLLWSGGENAGADTATLR